MLSIVMVSMRLMFDDKLAANSNFVARQVCRLQFRSAERTTFDDLDIKKDDYQHKGCLFVGFPALTTHTRKLVLNIV